MAFWDKEELLLTVDKNATEKITIKRASLKGKEYIDVRINKFNEDGELQPTSKGVAIPADKFEEIANAVLNEPKDTPDKED